MKYHAIIMDNGSGYTEHHMHLTVAIAPEHEAAKIVKAINDWLLACSKSTRRLKPPYALKTLWLHQGYNKYLCYSIEVPLWAKVKPC